MWTTARGVSGHTVPVRTLHRNSQGKPNLTQDRTEYELGLCNLYKCITFKTMFVSTDSSVKTNLSKDVTDRLTQTVCLVCKRNLMIFNLSLEVHFHIKLEIRDHKFVVNLIMGCHSQFTMLATKQKSVFFFCC